MECVINAFIVSPRLHNCVRCIDSCWSAHRWVSETPLMVLDSADSCVALFSANLTARG